MGAHLTLSYSVDSLLHMFSSNEPEPTPANESTPNFSQRKKRKRRHYTKRTTTIATVRPPLPPLGSNRCLRERIALSLQLTSSSRSTFGAGRGSHSNTNPRYPCFIHRRFEYNMMYVCRCTAIHHLKKKNPPACHIFITFLHDRYKWRAELRLRVGIWAPHRSSA